MKFTNIFEMIRKKFKKAKKDYNKKCDGQQQTQQIQIPFLYFC